ncbi:MAG: type II toxin-antitoxin system RelE/ParE family toxin [Flavobacteriales bacterium]|nr:type II toxin-antitoxin system RelE/ParE family toxin [Flavobacteriales bacterium]
MASKKVIWSPRANIEFKDILEFYLERNDSATYSLKLLETVDGMIRILQEHPHLGRNSTDGKARVISFSQFLLFYDETESELNILSVWDNRQNPKRRIDAV